MERSYYSITVHLQNTFITLSNGLSQTYSLLSSRILYFKYLVSSHLPQNISLTLYNFSPPLTFLVFLLYSQSESYPSTSNFTHKFSSESTDNQSNNLSIYLESPKYMNLYISIQGNNKNTAEFSLSCTNTDLITELKINTELYEKIEYPRITQIYKIMLVEKGELRVYITPCDGMQKIEMYSSEKPENLESPDVIISKLGNGRIVAIVNNAENEYYINISTVESSNLFNGSCYEIIAFFFSRNDKYIEILSGNNGKLDAQVDEKSVIVS